MVRKSFFIALFVLLFIYNINCQDSSDIECNPICVAPNGKCVNGQCLCYSPWVGIDCSIKMVLAPNVTEPKIESSNPKFTLSNDENFLFEVLPFSVNEINSRGDILNQIKMDTWTFRKLDESRSLFISNLFNGAVVEYLIEEILNKDKEFSFAGNNFTVPKGGLKTTITIKNWTYINEETQLSLYIKTNVTNSNKSAAILNNSSNNNMATITSNNKMVLIRFQDKMLDGDKILSTFSKITQSDNYFTLELTLSRCNLCILDPDFTLVDIQNSDLNSDSNSDSDSSISKSFYLLPSYFILITLLIISIF